MMRVAVIGAGIAGLACANALRAAGHIPAIFEKSYGVGGRMSTRQAASGDADISFDHGATHFTVRSNAFKALVDDWHARDLAAPWPVAGLHAWVGTPTMDAPLTDMARHHDVRFDTAITAVTRHGPRWTVHSEKQRFDGFDAAVLAIPAEQAAPLLSLHDFDMARAAMGVTSRPVWSATFLFPERIAVLPDFLRGPAPLVHAVRSNARPGRGDAEHWVVQADWNWSEANIAREPHTVASALLAILEDVAGAPLPEPLLADAQRWRFAQPSGSDLGHLWNGAIGIGACGDWLSHGFVEYAWQSGNALGEAIAAEAVGSRKISARS
ncbi:MAG: NAD(P)/FAD-dependent oxidoreductase, partial [Sphingopyxis sp.]